MDSQEVGLLLQQCLAEAQKQTESPKKPTEEQTQASCGCRAALCPELSSLLQEAQQMLWPFVPERWQYKEAVEATDKSNLSSLIQQHLQPLLALLKASIVSSEPVCALAVVFLVDRFLYWTDESRRLLRITKLLHRLHPEVPVAPQLLIRQARVHLSSGKLQKAEYILSSLINNSGSTGSWVYQSESERALVQAVSLQVRGMVLQKLGLWLEAADLIWASLVGYYALPKPDKKGIGTSLGLLANILVSMNDEDFDAFKTNPDVDLSLLGESSHRLLSAARAAKMAVVYSQYTPLYVLTNAVSQGTSLISYSFSISCDSSLRRFYLLQAREAFEIGLLTKSSSETVTSVQELHTFLKSAYSLAVTQKWLGADPETVDRAKQACKEALGLFYNFCKDQNQDKDATCGEIMQLISEVTDLLQVTPFGNSDKLSFVPDSFRNMEEPAVDFNLEKFAKILLKFKKFHATSCEMERTCKSAKGEQAQFCITALGTTVGTLSTECSGIARASLPDASRSSSSSNDLGSSWNKVSLSNSLRLSCGSPMAAKIESLPTTETDDDKLASSLAKSGPSFNASPHSWNFQMLQAALETVDTESDDQQAMLSLSQSYGSNSSWEKLSASGSFRNKPMLAKAGSKSSESGESLFHLETLDSETAEASHLTNKQGSPNMVNGNASLNPKQISNLAKQCASTDTSSGSSFEMVEQAMTEDEGEREHRDGPKGEKNLLCYNCVNESFAKASEGLCLLTQLDFTALLAGVCHRCLLQRLHIDTKFQLKQRRVAYSGLHLKFSRSTGLWSGRETCAYIGDDMDLKGKQREALWLLFLHQEERLSSYVGKEYLSPRHLEVPLQDVERQMTAQFYVTHFNKSLYEREQMAQIFYIPSDALLMLEQDQIVGCVSVEPFMLGHFVKLTNNTGKTEGRLRATDYGLAFGHFTYLLSAGQEVVVDLQGERKIYTEGRLQATDYGLAFGHFTYLLSAGQEVVVDLQGWVTANGKGLTYLTDPQIHSTRTPRGPSNPFGDRGLRYFLEEQHGPQCNSVCTVLQLPPLSTPAPKTHGL